MNSDRTEPTLVGGDVHDHPTADAPVAPASRSSAEAPRPRWVHAAATPGELLAQAERAVGERYRIESLAGQGGMGRVFSARDTQLGRRVAIKLLTVLDPHPGEDPGLLAHGRLVAEARAMARLNHPNLCRVIEVSLVGETPFLVMDWAEGVPFDAHCRRLDTRQRVTVLLQVLDAVAAMHHEGLVHGDLKPANILIGPEGKVTIVDFGLARAESDPSWIATPRGGTPGYAAPESITGGAAVGPEADVFAAGVMLYEVLTNRTPFYRHLAPAVMVDLLNRGGLSLPEAHAPDTPADLQKICLAALEADPQHRYPDAAAMAADIRRYLRRETVSARPRILETRFDDQIEQQIAQAAEWRRLGMITGREAEVVTRVLGELQRSESPWIIDARRLRASQVSLYLGGWVLLLGLVLGLTNTWGLIPTRLAVGVAWALSAVAATLGLRLEATGEKRVGIGMLVTAHAALVAAAWLTLRETGWLAGQGGVGAGPAAEVTVVFGLAPGDAPIIGVANLQLFAIGVFGLAIAAWLRWAASSAAFTFSLVVFTAWCWLAVYLALGGLAGDSALAVGRWGLWLALLGVACVPIGLAVDRREHDLIRELGRRRAKRRDAAPILCGSVLACVAGVTAVALVAPGWYLGRPVAGEAIDPSAQAWAFLVNGAGLVVLMIALGRRATPLRRRLAEVLRWVVPTHLMMPLLFMEVHESWGVWAPWIVMLPLVALGFCFASAVKQWKPFLLSGLAYLAVWYARGFARLEEELAGSPGWRIGLTVAFLVAGPAMMILAWKAPAWIAARRLRRWALDHPVRRAPRERSWR